MIRYSRFGLLAVVLALLFVPPAAGQDVPPYDRFGGWSVFKFPGAECWMVTPEVGSDSRPVRGGAAFWISVLPRDRDLLEPAFTFPAPVVDPIYASIGGATFTFIAEDDWAWPSKYAEQMPIVDAASRTPALSVEVRYRTGEIKTHRFQTDGIGEALGATKHCIRNNP